MTHYPCHLVNGEWTDVVAVTDRGFAFGDGVFETMLWCGGDLVLWSRHLARLQRACQQLLIPLEAVELDSWVALVHKKLTEMPIQGARMVVKLIVTRGYGGRGYVPASGPAQPTIVFSILPFNPSSNGHRGVTLEWTQSRLSENPELAGLKHLNRLDYVLAGMAYADRPEHCLPLLQDQQSRIIESLHHNIFLLIDGDLVTPRLDRCGVAGVMRALILDEIAPAIGVTTATRGVTLADVDAAAEIFVCNSVRGLWPVVKLGHHGWPVGPITRQIQTQLQARYGAAYA